MNRMDERRSARSPAVLMAVIEFRKKRIVVRVRDVSAHGALILGAKLPATNAQVRFQCDDVAVDSRIAWSDEGRAGLHFAEPVNPQRLRAAMRRAAQLLGHNLPQEVD